MDNKSFLEELKFGMGDGHLHYYLYNFKCPELPPDKVGVAILRVWLLCHVFLIGWSGIAVNEFIRTIYTLHKTIYGTGVWGVNFHKMSVYSDRNV